MTGKLDEMKWDIHPVDPILLNALAERDGDDSPALADDSSQALVREAFESAVDAESQDRFDEAAEGVQTGSHSIGDDQQDIIKAVVSSVRERLAANDVSVIVTHENSLSLSNEEALVYTFSMTREAEPLTRLDVSETVMDAMSKALDAINGQEWERAADELKDAVSAAQTISDSVITRTVRALCCHWAGADQQAIDLVGEAVSLDSNTWLPWLPGYSADADPAYATTDEFRADKYSVAAFLRLIAKVPEEATITPAIGYSMDGDIEWTTVDPSETCFPIRRLTSETFIRFQIEGPVDAFPAFQAYYIGLGIVDLEVNEIRDVLNVLEDGPTGERVTETVQFVQSGK
ncbi:hypothetical protein [Natronosalvus rutilus]|uniref:Uncharacterized protein n=1 Tax=Natronosalvus rutilus TaxID=2953753 RepID=A0A9E7NER5_9EURY|nr:hypothetical protein [Natronosalvus rutilus]UTF55703.1 hypothetical protein NGM29_18595 [Natronosalvus rutilus]